MGQVGGKVFRTVEWAPGRANGRVYYPQTLLSSTDIPEDVKERARALLDDCTKSSVGAYSPSNGLFIVRHAVAEYISARDGVASSPEDIYMGSGASDVIKAVLTMFIEEVDGKPPELGIAQADYYLEENSNWALTTAELERSWHQASERHNVRALVVINPGNPTGQVLTRQNIEDIIKFAKHRNLFILADEVYQENIVSKPFYSFKKVMAEMGHPYSKMELASFVTLSKGWSAECGLRSGYVELVRLNPDVEQAFRTTRAVMQCPTVLGQCALHCVFSQELNHIHCVLTERTKTAFETFNSIPGYFCNELDGSMFAYPRVEIPERAQQAAKQHEMSPDEFYCWQLLEMTEMQHAKVAVL
ncbi:putative Alanine aminotransferase [Operophtera brumata]|uniref:alanine transaminase n=1 Tax=Operophtera brumata TaxID=104452 RepID=A0A0L7KV95_OPEBR|nr:putative Alanine aminotransferase [Operophtera brumata]